MSLFAKAKTAAPVKTTAGKDEKVRIKIEDPSFFTKVEKLEQLRVIENGFKIKMIEAATSLIGIDTQEDYEEALKKY